MNGRTTVVRLQSGSCRHGGHDGYWHSEMVQPDEGLWIHSATGRRQRRLRSYLRGRARGLELPQRGSSGRIRAGQQPRQAGGGKSQNALTANALTATPSSTACRRVQRRQQIGNILQVIVRDNNVDQALRVLKKKMQREGVFREMKRRKAYEKPSERKTREKAEAIRRARKLARKKLQREGLLPMKPRAIPGVLGRGGPPRVPRF